MHPARKQKHKHRDEDLDIVNQRLLRQKAFESSDEYRLDQYVKELGEWNREHLRRLLKAWAWSKVKDHLEGLGYSSSSIYERPRRQWTFEIKEIDYNDQHFKLVDHVLHNVMDQHLREVVQVQHGVHPWVVGGTIEEKIDALKISKSGYYDRLNKAYEVLIRDEEVSRIWS